MYKYEKRNSKLGKTLALIISMLLVSALSIYIYDMYIKIDITSYTNNNPSTADRMNVNEVEKNAEDNITNTLEDITKSIVGISKIKNAGASVLGINSAESLGLGTGIIVSSNGYILTNWHVAGNKYSKCYITIDNGEIYDGKVVWADEKLDVAVVKISAVRIKVFIIRRFR